MSSRDALIAATKGGPDLLGISSETGTREPRKSADGPGQADPDERLKKPAGRESRRPFLPP